MPVCRSSLLVRSRGSKRRLRIRRRRQIARNSNNVQGMTVIESEQKAPGASHRWTWLPAIVVALLCLCVTSAFAETRALKIQHLHTGEKAEIVFKRNGRYDQAGLKKINFMLRDWRRNEPTRMIRACSTSSGRLIAPAARRPISMWSAPIARRRRTPCCAAARRAWRGKASTWLAVPWISSCLTCR